MSVFAICFSGFLVTGLLSLVGGMIMRVRLSRFEEWRQVPWWERGDDQVSEAYKGAFADSRIPLFRESMFWLAIAFAACSLVIVFWRH